ncbi:MAG: hypothetical protein DMF91_11540 [Acidobacteria bacterium]|nr:MAG: hypothetical protein DMF91_11540 [Acidobacteriota bacterium]
MGIQQKLHTKLVQKLILTPSLQQAIKLLPMSTLELSDLLNQEMVENPMLEEVPTEELQPAEAQAAAEKPDPEQQGNKTDTWDDQDYEYFFGDYLDDGYRPRAPQEIKELPPIENTLSTSSSLSDHLMWQLSMQSDESQLREIGSAIIGNLDDDGYLVASSEELAAMGPWAVYACCCSCATSGWKARPPKRSSPTISGCCRTIRCRRSRASSGSASTT